MNDHTEPDSDHAEVDPLGVLDSWRLAMTAEGRSADTIRLRIGAVRVAARMTGRPVHELTTEDLRTWLARHPNQNTKVAYYHSALALSRFLVAEGHRPDDPTSRINAPRKPRGTPRPCSTPTLYALLDAAPTGRARAMIVLAAFEGLRAFEVAQVRGEDVDVDAQVLHVVGKGGIVSQLPLHPEVAALVPDMPARGYWFPSTKARDVPVRANAVTSAVQRAAHRAGVTSTGAHELRHWFGTWVVRSGADLRTAQTLLRHASLNTTQVYVEVAEETRRAAVLRLPGLPGPDAGGAR
jgi:integrase